MSERTEEDIPVSLQELETLPPVPLESNGEINSAALKVRPAELIRPPSADIHIGPFTPVQTFESIGGLNIRIRRDQLFPIHVTHHHHSSPLNIRTPT